MAGRLRVWLSGCWAEIVQSPRSKVAAASSLLLGAAVGVVPEQHIYNYMWRDPAFCADCHVHDYANEAYERSVHAGLTTCHDCHLVPIRHYPRNLYVTVFDTPQGPEDITRPEVPTVVCTRCHSKEADSEPLTGPMPQELRARIVKVDDSPLHRAHMESETREPGAAKGGGEEQAQKEEEGHAPELHLKQMSWDKGVIGCVDCHGSDANRAHRFEATRESCVECHEDTTLHGGTMATADCRQCHLSGFLGAGGVATR